MNVNEFVNKVKPHGIQNSAPPTDAGLRHVWESLQLFSVVDCLKDDCSILDYGCGGKGTLQHTLFNHYPNAKYYGLDIEHEGTDNSGFNQSKLQNNSRVYLGYIDELENILPTVDAMVMGSVFTHLSLSKMTEVLDKTLPHYERGFQLGFTSFLGSEFQFCGSHIYDDNPDTWWWTIIKFDWYAEYCNKHGLEIILHDYCYQIPVTLPDIDKTNIQRFMTIKKR